MPMSTIHSSGIRSCRGGCVYVARPSRIVMCRGVYPSWRFKKATAR